MTGVKRELSQTIPFDRVESIFHQVMELPPSQRSAEIRRLSGDIPALITEIDSLVRSAAASEKFLENHDALGSAMITQLISAWSHPQAMDSTVIPHLASSSGDSKVVYPVACQFLAKYRPDLQVIEQVGEGAAGIVVRARDRRLGRDVAVKLLHANWAARLGVDYLEREAQAASLSNDHVVRVYEVAPPGASIHFLVLEWISGPSLRAWLSEHTALPPREAARLALQIASGLASVHQHGFIHGDIKPANVMLEPQGTTPKESNQLNLETHRPAVEMDLSRCRAKLADFGLARRLSSTENLHCVAGASSQYSSQDSTSEGRQKHFMGTPAYASPEQLLNGLPGSIASDVWSLGATLYHALVGTPPYSGRPHAIVRQMSSGDVNGLRKLDSRIPKDLESICMKALSRVPEQRYVSASQLAEDLQRFLDGQPVLARPISTPQRILRLVKQRPLISTLTLLLALTLVTGAVVSNSFRIKAEKNFELATANLQKAAAERDRAKAVVELLQGMISAADVNYGDRDVRMIDALAGLESRIASELSELPDIEADVSQTLANLYFSIADYEKARFHFEKAVQLRGANRDSQEFLEDRIGLANTQRWLYLPEKALALSKENWLHAQNLLGQNHETTLFAGEVLAGCYQDLGKYKEAESIFRLVLLRATEVLGTSHERTLQIRSGLASVLISCGRFADAESELQHVKALHEASGMVSTRESLILGSNLALTLAELGRLEEAIEQQRQNADLSSHLLGEFHDATITAKLNLAESIRRAGRTDESLALCRQLLESCSQALGWDDNGTLGALESVSLMLVRLKEYEAALDLVTQAEEQLQTLLEPQDDWLFRVASYRAAALSGLRRHGEAVPLYQDALTHFQSKYGRSHAFTLTLTNNYGVALIEAERADEAIQLLQILLEETQDKFDSMRPIALRNLGHAFLSHGQIDQAQITLEQALNLSQSRGELENARRCEQLLAEIQTQRQ